MARLINNDEGWVSAAIFSHPDIYEQELEQVFARMWLFVGHESQIPNPGDFVRSRMGEEQVIVTRGKDHKVYVLLNSCPHRGNMVCRYDSGHGLAFQCSFHGWTFGSDGKLINLCRRAPRTNTPPIWSRKSGACSRRAWRPSTA
jgi:phenylpropionate dioxygenase-like ring-hydroxylating dioxygenase large terminal subunit